MTTEDVKGFAVTPGRVSFFLSLFAVVAIAWNIMTFAKDEQTARILIEEKVAQVQRDMDKRDDQIEKLIESTTALREQVSELVIVIKGSPLAPHRK